MKLPQADWRRRSGLEGLLAVLGADQGQTRFVGGCVRDTLLELDVSDIDLATRLTPEEVVARIEGAGINVMFGGSQTASSALMPSDITIRRNHVYKDPAWKGVWTVKNLLEFKIGRRVLIEGNVLENNWRNAQTGFAINLKSTNQTGAAPWSETSR